MVARTETRKIQYEGTFARFKENNVKRVRWLHSTLPNARPDHLARHRKEYNIDEAPPLGEPNCRCVYVPVISKPGAELEPEPGPEYEPGSVAERLSDERLNNASDEILQEYAVFRKESEPVDRLVNETRDEARKHIEIVNKYPDMIEKEKQNYQSLLEMKEEWSKTAPELVPMVEEQMRESMKKINDWSDIFEKSYASQWDAVDKFNGALAEQRRLRNEYLDRVHPKLYIYDTAPKHGFKHVDITEQTPYTKYKVVPREASAAMIERERRADEFLGHMVAPHKLKNGIKSGEVEVNVKIGTYRSSASVGPVPYTRVNMEATAEARIFVHEISHHIEYNNIDIFHAASAYREQEATEAGLKKLSSITGINSYDASEVAYVGNYPHPYMGKFYNTPGDRDPTKPGSTEVISYGMEMLYDEPETLIVQHNKFFKWLIRTMN